MVPIKNIEKVKTQSLYPGSRDVILELLPDSLVIMLSKNENWIEIIKARKLTRMESLLFFMNRNKAKR